jgi:hypothetical protein
VSDIGIRSVSSNRIEAGTAVACGRARFRSRRRGLSGLRTAARAAITAALLALALGAGSTARADELSLGAAGSEPPADVGDGRDALPALGRVGVSTPLWPGVGLAWTGGYGYTESVLGDEDSHHRIGGTLGASWRPSPVFAVGLRLDGRRDSHSGLTGDPDGKDDGYVGDTRLIARAGTALGARLHGSGQLVLWFPGDEPMKPAFDGASADLLGLLTYTASPALRLALNGGVRIDRSASSAPEAPNLSDADRLSLGVSDSSAVLLGAGAAYRSGGLELWGEWSLDLLFGGDAPSAGESPMRLAGGARVRVSDRVSALAGVELGLSSRPPVGPMDALVPVEPRLAITIGAVWHLGGGGKATARTDVIAGDDDDGADELPVADKVLGRIVAQGGAPLAGVKVRAGDVEATTDDDGWFELTGVPPGEVTLQITPEPPYAPTTATVVVGRPGGGQTRAVTLGDLVVARDLPPGQIRGVVRTLAGKAIVATIRVEPIGRKVTTDRDGSFRVDVPPGDYDVVIEADDAATQRRHIQVEQNGVTVLNVDLRPAGSGGS